MQQHKSLRWLGPSCPECGELAGVSRMFWGLGKPFKCSHCETALIVGKGRNLWLGLSAYIAFWRLRQTHEGGQLVALFVIICLVLLIIDWVTLTPKRFSPGSGG